MPKLPVINGKEAERILLKAGFVFIRSKGSHRIYMKGDIRMIVPYHGKKSLHPKIVQQIIEAVEKEK